MKKSKLVDILKKASIAEERSVPVYTRHLNSAVFWIDIENQYVQEVRDLLTRLSQDSVKHKGMVDSLLEMIGKEDKDDF